MSALGQRVRAAVSGAAQSQKPKPEPPHQDTGRESLADYITVHDTALAAQAVQSWLAALNLPGAQEMRGSGGGALITTGRLVIDGNGYGGGSGRQTPTGDTTCGMGQLALDLGLILFRNRWLRIYPLLGVGGMGGGATCQPPAGADGRCGTQWAALLLRAGVGLDLTLRLWRVGVFIGFRFGYQSASRHLQWGNGPEIGAPEGPFFRVVGGPFFAR
jgi:hypothetical protein